MLSTKALQEFKEVWEQEFGEEISDDFAVPQAINLLTLFDVIYQPIEKKSMTKLYERKNET